MRRLNVDIMELFILAVDHARTLKFTSYIHLLTLKNLNIVSEMYLRILILGPWAL